MAENGENGIEKEKKIDSEIAAHEQKRREKEQIGDERGIYGAEIVEEMEQAFIDYAMSVIVDRALPSVEDGLKPVHRRILYAMHTLGLDASKPTRKSATVVGEVIGKYHPHGDIAVYDSLVRLAQEFSLRYPLIHGQGNFGSMDGDSPAAQRYTEAKLSKISAELIVDLEKETVNMRPNFDNSLKEPETMPGKLPNLLLNGATGIAVGMATNIPPHNLSEICDAIIEYINNPNITVDELTNFVKGPDFPTGGMITGGIKDMYRTGKGRIIIRARTELEEDKKGKTSIIVTEIPYMVNKSDLVKNIAQLATDKKLPDISDLRDESAKGKVRIVIELKKGVESKFTLNQLYKLTNIETRFDANLLALVGKQPRVLNLRDIIFEYVKYRQLVVRRRGEFDLRKAKDRLEIVIGLLIALKDIDKIVELIKKSEDAKDAFESLIKKFELTERQAKAVLEIRLQQLTHLEAGKLREEEKKLKEIISDLENILSSEKEILKVIKKEITEIKNKYGDERRTKVLKRVEEITEQDLIEKKDVVVMVTNSGYIKRVDVKSYKEQKRGGVGVTGADLKDEDFVNRLITCSTHDYLLFFTSRGRLYWLKANDIPASERISKGKAIINLLNLRDETIANVLSVSDFEKDYLMFVTKLGIVKKLALKDIAKPRSTGVRIMNMPADGSDTLISVMRVADKQEVLLTTKDGKAIRFNADEVRSMGRSSYGVKGVELNTKDLVVSLVPVEQNKHMSILSITEKGYGKRSSLDEYRLTGRGGKGVINIRTEDRNGNVIRSLPVTDDSSIIATTTKGMIVRISVDDLREMGRATQGVRIVKLKEGDKVADVVLIADEEIIVSDEKEK
ncbi:DNA gyrase subunit A [Candidatus Pacearchaeota archaeon]|nr:DNA gyrase subunit A [Candidatus Pacearchaeota archaeon]